MCLNSIDSSFNLIRTWIHRNVTLNIIGIDAPRKVNYNYLHVTLYTIGTARIEKKILRNHCIYDTDFFSGLQSKISLCGSDGKASAYNVGDLGSIPGLGRSPGEGKGNPFQYSCWENPMDEGAWWARVRGVAKSQTRLRNFTKRKIRLPF